MRFQGFPYAQKNMVYALNIEKRPFSSYIIIVDIKLLCALLLKPLIDHYSRPFYLNSGGRLRKL
jgi:hypothetical protein